MKRRQIVILLGIILAICLATIRAQLEKVTLPAMLGDGLTFTLGILYESLPFIFMGVFFSVVIQQFVSQKRLLAILPKNLWLQRLVLSLTGSFLPVCECGNVPTARGFIMKGVAPASVLTFLLAAPIINPITMLTTAQAFSDDGQMVVLRFFGAFIIANIVGWVFIHYKKHEVLTKSFISHCDEVAAHQHKKTQPLIEKARRFISGFSAETQLLLPSLVGGSVLAGVIQTAVPRSLLLTLSSEPTVAILTMMLLAFVVSICANVDAFFALALASVFPVSAILAFLLFGPMIDIKMIALLRTTFTTTIIIKVGVLVGLLVLLLSLGVHYAF